MIDKYLEKSGLDTNVYSTHKLRHTAATLMYKYGNVDIRALQEILGHESVATTQIYTHIDNDRLREAVKSNPIPKVNTSFDDFVICILFHPLFYNVGLLSACPHLL